MNREVLDRVFPLLWGAALAAVLGWVTLWWLMRNDLPDGYQNEFIHLYTLTEIFFRGRDDSLAEAWPFLWGEYWPPGIHLTAASVMAVFGRSKDVAILSLLVHLALLLGVTTWMGQRLKDRSTGALAALLLASYPAIFGNIRRFEPNIALAAFVAAAAAVLVVHGRLRDRRDALIFALLCSAGLLVDRVAFAIYVAPLAALALATVVRRRGATPMDPALKRWAFVAAIVVVCCGYYYALFFKNHVWEVITQIEGEKTGMGEESATFALISARNLLYYPLSFVDCQMGLVPALWTFAGVGAYVTKGRRALPAESRRMLELWLLFGLGLFTLVAKKQPYYSIPLLAPIALVAALGWRTLPWSSVRAVLAGAVLFFGAHQVGYFTFDRGLVPTPGKWAWLAGRSPLPPGYLGNEYLQAGIPHRQGLRIHRMIDLCDGVGDPVRPYTVLFSEGQGAYEGQVMPTLRLGLDTRRVEGLLMTPEAFDENTDHASCFVYIAAGAHAWPTGPTIRPILEQFGYAPPSDGFLARLALLRNRAELLERWTSEQGEVVHVYSLRAPTSARVP